MIVPKCIYYTTITSALPHIAREALQPKGAGKSSASQKFHLNPPHITSQPALAPKQTHITMVLRIRLARFGKKHAPFYNIVVAHARYVVP
jgi:hypothetical protein